jgi:small-conductance mechanosensitive channel
MQNIDWNDIVLRLLDFVKVNAIGILIAVGIILALGRVFVLIANRYVREDERRHAIRKWTRYVTLFFSLEWVLLIYNSYTGGRTPFVLFLIGVFLAGVAFSMRDIFSNIVGWLLIISGKGFSQGDRVKIENLTGDVIDIGILRTTLAEIGDWVGADQSTGRLVSIPNSLALTQPIYNYTQGYDFIWHEIKILVTFESDWQRAENIIAEVAQRDFEQKKEQIQERLRRVRSRYLVRYNFISPKVYVLIADSGVQLALRYLVRARRRRTLEDSLSREILLRFKQEPSIEFAYPTIRVFRQGEDVAGGGKSLDAR